MQKYVCLVCGYVYDPAEGDPDNDIAPGTKFEDIPDDWVCPICGAGKEEFEETEQVVCGEWLMVSCQWLVVKGEQ